MNTSINFQLGLLHFVHLLANVDGVVDDRERKAMWSIKDEEKIADSVFNDFEKKIQTEKAQTIYQEGVSLLNSCTEEERLCAFVHLYRLAKADQNIHIREVRLLLYGIKEAKIEFDDVMLSANMVRS
jgi:uncharacterized tellurite resistance protein B-like protein